MARLAGVDLPRNKRIIVALTYIYGIGPKRSENILKATGISPDLRTDDLTDEDIKLLRNELSNYHIEGDLRREVTMNIKRLQEIGDNTSKAITDATSKVEKGKNAEQSRSIKPQDKTGSYREKRKPGDYLK